jgi:antitoxin component of MazEF toxin-antitoxin module
MSEIRMRPKHQLTLPANIVRQANLATDDRLDVSYSNGVIVLTPKSAASGSQAFDLMAYAGIGKGMWGNTPEEVNHYIRDLRA